jgi:5-methylcytosine-specific restriction endonuclease McrA
MSNEVYANMMEISCKAGDGKSICSMPDVCMTPPQTPATPPGVPIPYPNTGMSSDCSDGSSTVMISGQEVMLKDKSYFKKSTGDEAGCAPMKGVVTATNTGKVYFTAWSMDVLIEGENVDRHLDLTTHNHASPPPNDGVPWPEIDKMAPPGSAKNKPCEQKCKDKKLSKEQKGSLRKTKDYDKAKERVNSGPKPLTCPTCKSKVNYLSPDHIMPIEATAAMPGFACLSKEDQSKVVNHPANFVGLCPSCNSSKSDTLWFDYTEHKKKGITYDAELKAGAEDHSAAVATKQWEMVKSMDCA